MSKGKKIEDALRAVMGPAWTALDEAARDEAARYQRGEVSPADRAIIDEIADRKREEWETMIEAMGLGDDGAGL